VTNVSVPVDPGGSGSEARGGAEDKAKEVASQAQDRARDAAHQARGRVRDEVDRRSTEVGDRIGAGAGDARSVADELRKQGKEAPARYVEQAADRVERLGGYLRQSDGDHILRDVEDFARRRPWAVAVGGLLAGFAASRMLKASSGERYRATGGAHGTRPAPFEPHS
jgi:ElaB/YqjD/DUF883 family membrane-anchored ribosome-binding protein